MGKKALYIILAVIVLIALYYVVGPARQEAEEGPTPGDGLPIEEEFDSKIVYTTDTSLDAGPFEADCEARKGAFNECGTICEPEAEFCAEVCAYTCEFEKPKEEE